MQLTPARVVAFVVTPILTAAASVLTAWLGKHFPGLPHLNSDQVVAFGAAGATAALSASLKWLHGQSAWERAQAEISVRLHEIEAYATRVDPTIVPDVEHAAVTEAGQLVTDAAQAIDPHTQPTS
jgi:hypothetical protein